MPYYKIIISLRTGRTISGIKEDINPNIDNVYHIYETKAFGEYGSNEISSFDCVMISKRSNDYKAYIQSLLKKKEAEKWF